MVNPSATLEEETYRLFSGMVTLKTFLSILKLERDVGNLKICDVLMLPLRRGCPQGAESRDYLLCHHKTPPVPSPASALASTHIQTDVLQPVSPNLLEAGAVGESPALSPGHLGKQCDRQDLVC